MDSAVHTSQAPLAPRGKRFALLGGGLQEGVGSVRGSLLNSNQGTGLIECFTFIYIYIYSVILSHFNGELGS